MEKAKILQSLSVRLLDSVSELTMVRDLEKVVWAQDDPVPLHQTVTAVKNGGMVLGAFWEERLIGFQYSFAGFDGKKAYLCSHTLGIHPDFRGIGIGEKLKREQRIEAIRKGYDLITWTYDPLETVNANLNIKKLGAVCSRYLENCYGEMTDILNAGVPSDRFQVEWRITNDRVNDILNQDARDHGGSHHSPRLIQVTTNGNGFAVPKDLDMNCDQLDDTLFVPVPAEFQKIKKHDLNLAIDWRLKTRAVFTHYFQQGWQVVDFVKNDRSEPVHHYVLQKINRK